MHANFCVKLLLNDKMCTLSLIKLATALYNILIKKSFFTIKRRSTVRKPILWEGSLRQWRKEKGKMRIIFGFQFMDCQHAICTLSVYELLWHHVQHSCIRLELKLKLNMNAIIDFIFFARSVITVNKDKNRTLTAVGHLQFKRKWIRKTLTFVWYHGAPQPQQPATSQDNRHTSGWVVDS